MTISRTHLRTGPTYHEGIQAVTTKTGLTGASNHALWQLLFHNLERLYLNDMLLRTHL